MKLYWSRLSPFVRKVMIVAHEAGMVERLELADITVSMSAANLALLPDNPLSRIPTLVLDDGSSLHDSPVICEYLDALQDGPRLFPVEGPARWAALKRQALGDGMMEALLVWRQERLKPPERQTPEWLTTYALKIETALDQLDRDAVALGAEPFDIGHVSLGCALSYLDVRFRDLGWREGRPALAEWHASFEGRPSARATHPGEPA
jgi:glutathione S-transferase